MPDGQGDFLRKFIFTGGCIIISGMWTVSGSAIRTPEFLMGVLLRSIL